MTSESTHKPIPWAKYIVYLVVGAISSLSTVAVQYSVSSTEEKTLTQAQTEALIEHLSNDRQWQLDRAKLCEDQLEPLRIQVSDLEIKVKLLESASQQLPVPTWLKDRNGVMLALNAEYERIFLAPSGLSEQDYLGKTDFDIWPEVYAKKYKAIDQVVLQTKRVWMGEEWVIVNDSAQKWRIIKYPRYSGTVLVGVGGIAIPPITQSTFTVAN